MSSCRGAQCADELPARGVRGASRRADRSSSTRPSDDPSSCRAFESATACAFSRRNRSRGPRRVSCRPQRRAVRARTRRSRAGGDAECNPCAASPTSFARRHRPAFASGFDAIENRPGSARENGPTPWRRARALGWTHRSCLRRVDCARPRPTGAASSEAAFLGARCSTRCSPRGEQAIWRSSVRPWRAPTTGSTHGRAMSWRTHWGEQKWVISGERRSLEPGKHVGAPLACFARSGDG